MFKFNLTPEDIIIEGMLRLGTYETLHQFYKKLAKMLHPDKNEHELANKVFQKVTQAYQSVSPILKKQDEKTAAEMAKHVMRT